MIEDNLAEVDELGMQEMEALDAPDWSGAPAPAFTVTITVTITIT